MSAPYNTVVSRIQELAAEQQQIYRGPVTFGLEQNQRLRLAQIKAELQQLWLERKRGRVNFRDALEDFSEDRKFTNAAS